MSEPDFDAAHAHAEALLDPADTDAGYDGKATTNLARAYLALRLLPTGAAGERCEHQWRGLGGGAQCVKCGKQVALHEDICKAIGAYYAALEALAREPVANVGQPECKRCHGYHEAAVCPFSDALLDLHSVLPVAWAIHYPNASYVQYTESKATADACLGAKVTPLYTHPPTPEAGTVTEAMALAAAREHAGQMGESFDAMWDQMDERERAEFVIDWSVVVRCALAGRRGA